MELKMLTQTTPLAQTGLSTPPIIFGTSCLGNLYQALPYATKLDIVKQCFAHVKTPVLDCAGKYGAGLALETIGRALGDLGIEPGQVLISNKLGWKRVPLEGPEPTFEPGAWVGIDHDAKQAISYDGIRECWEQGCELLGSKYRPQIISVHDPDEYLAAAKSPADRGRRFDDVLGAYQALGELRAAGQFRALGVGAKDWRVIRELDAHVKLDWVMFACSMTIYTHPPELLEFMADLKRRGVAMINSAVFNAGFLIGGAYFDYLKPDPVKDAGMFRWREKFLDACTRHKVDASVACVQFGLSVPGVVSVALNTSRPERVADNVVSVVTKLPPEFWADLKKEGIIDAAYPYVG